MVFKKSAKKNNESNPQKDLLQMKKKELLEIMLEQGREIDRLRARVSELESELEVRELDFEKIGSLAEASLYITDIFREADMAAITYLRSIRSKVENAGKNRK